MTLHRAILEWPPDTFYFMSPDGERWLEVTERSFLDAPSFAADAVKQLRDKLESGGQIRLTRSYLARMDFDDDKAVTFL